MVPKIIDNTGILGIEFRIDSPIDSWSILAHLRAYQRTLQSGADLAWNVAPQSDCISSLTRIPYELFKIIPLQHLSFYIYKFTDGSLGIFIAKGLSQVSNPWDFAKNDLKILCSLLIWTYDQGRIQRGCTGCTCHLQCTPPKGVRVHCTLAFLLKIRANR